MVSSWLTAQPPTMTHYDQSGGCGFSDLLNVMLQQFEEKLWFLQNSFRNRRLVGQVFYSDFESGLANKFSWEKTCSFCDLIEWCGAFGREGEDWWVVKAFSTRSIIPANPETWQGCRLQLPVSSYKKEKILPHGNTSLIEWCQWKEKSYTEICIASTKRISCVVTKNRNGFRLWWTKVFFPRLNGSL
jgi:hypothetical protein